MPLTTTLTVQVYRLWLTDEVDELFEAIAPLGWVGTKSCVFKDSQIVWGISVVKSGTQDGWPASTADVALFDGVRPVTQTLADYNAANPGNQIEDGS